MCFELHALRSSQPPTDPGHASICRYDRSLSGFPKPGVDLTHRKTTFDHGITFMRDPSEFVITWDICFYHLALTAKASLGCYDRMVARILHSPCPASSQTCATPPPPTVTCNSKASSDYLSILRLAHQRLSVQSTRCIRILSVYTKQRIFCSLNTDSFYSMRVHHVRQIYNRTQ